MLELRDYQQECVKLVLEAYKRNKSGRELVVLPTGCHRAGQGILMYDGSIKPVENVAVGDLLMGPDSTPRRVLTLHRGQDEMFEVKPKQGTSWVVNKHHILTLDQCNEHPNRPYPSCKKGGNLCDVSVAEWLTWSPNKKYLHSLKRTGVDFPLQGGRLPMRPYLLGVLLGDGGLTIAERVHLTNPDQELVEEIEHILQESGLHLRPINSPNRCQSYALTGRIGRGRPVDGVQTIKRIMTELGLLPIRCEHRFIPHMYKVASRKERLELLAGLLDTDGYCSRGSGFEYCSKSETLADDVCFVARSLGLAAYKSAKIVKGETYYRVYISGNCPIIPTRIPRKQAVPTHQQKNVLRTRFTCEPTGTVEDYYGFTVDGDHRYLLDDFTVTHNSGKTVVFCAVIDALAREHGLNTLIIAHRDELLDQAADKYRMVKPNAIIGKVGSGVHQYGGEVTVASIATISRPNHLKSLKAIGYGLIIVDEAHHQAAPGYQKVLEALSDSFVLSVTATPKRLDGKNIIDKSPLYQRTIIDMIQEKYLCDLKAIAIKTEVNLDEVHTSMGDFNEAELDLAVNTPARNQRIVDAYMEHTPNKRAVCFGVTVNHAQALAYCFNESGINAAVIAGNTPLEERKQIYSDFHHGKVKVLCNVMVLTEGWDEPLCEVAIMARPTQSQGLYIQQVGRILRLAPGKKYAVLLDITDNCLRHRIAPQNFKRVIKQTKEDETLLEAIEREEQEEAEEKEAVVRKLNDRRKKDITIDIFGLSEWKEKNNGMFVMEVGAERHRIALAPCKGDREGLYDVWARLSPHFDVGQKWMGGMPLDWCMQFAEKRAHQLLAGEKALVDKSAKWRNDPIDPTGKQMKFLKWKKLPVREGMTKGEASDLIDAWKAKKEQEEAAKEARRAEREPVEAVRGALTKQAGFSLMR